VEAARKNPNIVALTADLAGSLKLNQFIKEFPERFIQCGISEANMIGIGPD
jgi:transketolase